MALCDFDMRRLRRTLTYLLNASITTGSPLYWVYNDKELCASSLKLVCNDAINLCAMSHVNNLLQLYLTMLYYSNTGLPGR